MKPYLVKVNNQVAHAGERANNALDIFMSLTWKMLKHIIKNKFKEGTRGIMVFEDHLNKEQMIITVETKKIETEVQGD